MSNFTVAVKLLVVFGLLSLLVTQMIGGPSPFEDFSDTLSAGVDFPEFSDPFGETLITYTSFPNAPTELAFNGTDPPDVSFVGCENTTAGRVGCINGTNRSAYMEVTSNGIGRMRMSFNFSNPVFINIDSGLIRMVRFTVSCFAPTEDYAFPFSSLASIGEDPTAYGYITGCPVDDQPGTFSQEFHGDALLLKINGTGSGYPSSDLRVHFYLPFGLNNELPPEGTKVRIDFFKIEIAVAEVDSGCAAPEGAWLPWADEIACSISRFADFVWKGIQYLINGISFVLVSVGVVLVFLGQVVFGLLLGIITMAAWFLTIEAPDIIKAIFGVFTVAAISFPILTVAGLIRGTGA